MRIEVRYSTSEGPHVVTLDQSDIEHMRDAGELTITQPTRTGTKTITITGTQGEFQAMADLLQANVQNLA